MASSPHSRSTQRHVVVWALALISASALLGHLEHVLHFGQATGDWFDAAWGRLLALWTAYMVVLFGPSAGLLWLWWRTGCSGRLWLPALALALAVSAYQTWQPLVLAGLSAGGVYPTYLEAFHNFHQRGDWWMYPPPGRKKVAFLGPVYPNIAFTEDGMSEAELIPQPYGAAMPLGAKTP